MTDFTPQQRLAITTIDKNVAVSAGAGSGKTRVLVERFLYILQQGALNPAQAVQAADILAITFTRKAAAEMKGRVRRALAAHLDTDVDGFWRKQLQALEQAQIATIHSLCSRILRENPVEAQLDPNFVVAEEFQGSEFVDQCVQRYLRQGLAQGSGHLRRLLAAYGFAGFCRQLQTIWPKVPDILAEGDLSAAYAADPSAQTQLREHLCQAVRELAEEREELTKAGTQGRLRLERLYSMLEQVLEGIHQEPADFAPLEEALSGLTAAGKVKEPLNFVKGLWSRLAQQQLNAAALPLAQAWQQALTELQEYLQAQKQEQDLLTFDDLELLAVQLLSQNEQVRHKYQQRFRYIMVDEFQDTNDRQRQLIYLLCGEDKDKLQGNKLFIVGDPKQSIYRFRGADVSVFARVRQEIAQSGGSYLTLTQNFRSVNKVLEACNTAFAPLLGTDSSRDVFFEPLEANREGDLQPMLLQVLFDKETAAAKRQLEAEALAQKLRQLHEQGIPYEEMAVLLRAMTHCDTLTAALQRQGVPYLVVDGKGFYERQEVLDLLNLLTVLHNRYRSLELAGVLRSPYFGLDDATLTQLFLAGVPCLWDALQQADAAAFAPEQGALVQRAAQVLQTLRSVAQLAALPELWQQLWQLLAVDAVLPLQEHGAAKLANAQKLRRLAQEYCAAQRASLGAWLEYTQRVRAAEARETAANLNNAAAVSIMTIHKSKGLEFKAVFLPMLDTGVHGNTDEIAFLPGVGLGIKAPAADGSLQATGLLESIKERDKELEQAERVRQLYVGMTRAENILVMSGAVQEDKVDKQADKELLALSWLKQLQTVFVDGNEVAVEQVDLRDALPEGVAATTEAVAVTPELEQHMAPLPSYHASGKRYFTATDLQTYLHCPRQYYYQQLHLPVPEESEELGSGAGLPAYVTGLIVHRALEEYAGDVETALDAAVREFAPGNAAEEAGSLLRRYVNSPLYQSLPKEHKRELHFSLPTDAGLVLTGIIDFLGQEQDGTLTVVDYKTGMPPAPGEVKLGYAYQLALYKVAVEQLLHKPVGRAQLHFLQDLSVWELPAADAYLAEALELCRTLSAKAEEADFACNTEQCAYCPYGYICRKR